jgi:hypothetical protein
VIRKTDQPAVYARGPTKIRMPVHHRLFALGVAGCCLTVLVVAALLEPARSGIGTHEALGMQPCQFLARTGLPCPGCGMTTSFAWFVRGNIVASLWTQPLGTAFAITAAAGFWIGTYLGLTGRPAHRLLQLIPARYYVLPLIVLAFVAWGWKMFVHVKSIGAWNG